MESTQALTTADLANAANRHEEPAPRKPEDQPSGPLLPRDLCDRLRGQWEGIQTGFVDDPRAAVKEADELVASGIKSLAESFSDERAKLEQQWSKGDDVSTEDLRQALRRYRTFFHRLLAA